MKQRIISIALVLSLVAVLGIPTSAFAAPQSGNTQVTGVLNATYTLQVPTNFSFDTFTTAGAYKGALTLTAGTGGGTETKVTITALDGSHNGFLTNGATPLSSALQLGGTGLNTLTLSSSSQPLITDAALSGGTWTTSNLTITQPAFSSVAAGSYSTTITFTATFNP